MYGTHLNINEANKPVRYLVNSTATLIQRLFDHTIFCNVWKLNCTTAKFCSVFYVCEIKYVENSNNYCTSSKIKIGLNLVLVVLEGDAKIRVEGLLIFLFL
jgi:hypothetical protein